MEINVCLIKKNDKFIENNTMIKKKFYMQRTKY